MLLIETTGRLEPCELMAKTMTCKLGRNRLDVQSNIHGSGIGEQRLQPPRAHLARVTGHRQRLTPGVADLQAPGANVEGVRSDERGRDGSSAPGSRQQAPHEAAPETMSPGRLWPWSGSDRLGSDARASKVAASSSSCGVIRIPRDLSSVANSSARRRSCAVACFSSM